MNGDRLRRLVHYRFDHPFERKKLRKEARKQVGADTGSTLIGRIDAWNKHCDGASAIEIAIHPISTTFEGILYLLRIGYDADLLSKE